MDEIQSIDGSGNEYLYMVNGNTYGKVSMETLKRDVIDPSVASCSRNIPLWHKCIDMTDFFSRSGCYAIVAPFDGIFTGNAPDGNNTYTWTINGVPVW